MEMKKTVFFLFTVFGLACSSDHSPEETSAKSSELALPGTNVMEFPVKLYAHDRDTTLQPCSESFMEKDFARSVLGKSTSPHTKYFYCNTLWRDTILIVLFEEWNPDSKVPVRYLATFNKERFFIDILPVCDIPSIFASTDDPLKNEIFTTITQDLKIEIRQTETPRKGYEKQYKSSESIQRFKILPNGNFDLDGNIASQ